MKEADQHRQGALMNRECQPAHVDVRAVDVGYFNVKYTLGRKARDKGSYIGTGIFPALAPRLSRRNVGQIPASAALDGWMVAVDGVDYFVGKDAVFNSSGIEPRTVPANYSSSDRYLALLRGALGYMAADADPVRDLIIERLVLALPLNTFTEFREQLAVRATGEHLIRSVNGAHRRVTVRHAHVIVQPHGALLNYGVKMNGRLDGWALVVDPGGGTLDWYVASKAKASWTRSGAYPKAMLHCAYAVLDQVDPVLRDQFEIVARVDQAIREGAPGFRLHGRDHALEPFKAVIDAVLSESVEKMMAKVGSIADIDVVLLAGGGAQVLERFLAEKQPDFQHRIHLDADPIFSNVCGFQFYGELVSQRLQAS